jgi:hypothetical protein
VMKEPRDSKNFGEVSVGRGLSRDIQRHSIAKSPDRQIPHLSG